MKRFFNRSILTMFLATILGTVGSLALISGNVFADDSSYCPNGYSCVYWAGSGSEGFSNPTTGTSLSTAANWSTTPSNVNQPATVGAVSDLNNYNYFILDVTGTSTAPTILSNTLPSTSAGFAVLNGVLEFSSDQQFQAAKDSQGNVLPVYINVVNFTDASGLATPTKANVIYAGATTIAGSSPIVLNGFIPSATTGYFNVLNTSPNYVSGPLTIENQYYEPNSPTGPLAPNPVASNNILAVLSSPQAGQTENVIIGNGVTYTIGEVDFGSSASQYIITVDGSVASSATSGTIDLSGGGTSTGAVASVYNESFVGNGGIFEESSGIASLNKITLTANSVAEVVASTDGFTTSNFVPNGFSFQAYSLSDLGSYPTSSSSSSTTTTSTTGSTGSTSGTGGAGGSGSTTSGSTSPTSSSSSSGSTSTPTVPKAPDTGSSLTSAKFALPLLGSVALAAGALIIQKKLKKSTR